MSFPTDFVYGENPRDLDQFFTKPDVVDQCLNFFSKHHALKDFNLIIEPSSGNNDFVNGIYQQGVPEENIIWMDIDCIDENHRTNFMLFNVPEKYEGKRILTIGNPPFGKNSSKAIAFFNRAAIFSDVIAFIVPKTFRKASVINRLFCTFVMEDELELDANSFIFLGKDYKVECVFQIWKKTNVPRVPFVSRKETADFLFVTSKEEYHFIVRRVGVYAGRIFTDLSVKYSDQSHLFIQVKGNNVRSVHDRLSSLNLENCSSKYNSAGNPSLSATEICELYDLGYDTPPLKRLKL